MAEVRSSHRLGILGGVAGVILLLALASMRSDSSAVHHGVSMSAVEAAVASVHVDKQSIVAISEGKRAEMKKHAVSGASLVNTKMVNTKMEEDGLVPSSPLESVLGGSMGTPLVNQTTGKQITGIDPITGKRLDTGDMPSFIFPILLAIGGTLVMIGVFTYMCCFKTETKSEGKRAPAPAKV